MPELPEVETVARSIAPLVGRRIVSAEFRCLRVLRGGDPDHMAARLQGRRIAAVKRYGKFILVSLEGGGYLVDPPGHDGPAAAGRRPRQAHPRHPDPRPRRAAVRRQPPVRLPAIQRGISRACGASRSRSRWKCRSRSSPPRCGAARHASRRCCLNQTFVRGVGNIYADEALFRAGIHPLAMASRLRGDRARTPIRRDRRGTHRGHRRRRVLHLRLRGRAGPQGLLPIQPSRVPAHRRALCDLRHAHTARIGGAALVAFLPEVPEALSHDKLKPGL